MPAVHAKIVTIIAPSETHDKVAEALHGLGVRAFSFDRTKGQGVHGNRHGGLFSGDNVSITIVANVELAGRILAWVENELMPVFPAIAYSTDAQAVLGEHA